MSNIEKVDEGKMFSRSTITTHTPPSESQAGVSKSHQARCSKCSKISDPMSQTSDKNGEWMCEDCLNLGSKKVPQNPTKKKNQMCFKCKLKYYMDEVRLVTSSVGTELICCTTCLEAYRSKSKTISDNERKEKQKAAAAAKIAHKTDTQKPIDTITDGSAVKSTTIDPTTTTLIPQQTNDGKTQLVEICDGKSNNPETTNVGSGGSKAIDQQGEDGRTTSLKSSKNEEQHQAMSTKVPSLRTNDEGGKEKVFGQEQHPANFHQFQTDAVEFRLSNWDTASRKAESQFSRSSRASMERRRAEAEMIRKYEKEQEELLKSYEASKIAQLEFQKICKARSTRGSRASEEKEQLYETLIRADDVISNSSTIRDASLRTADWCEKQGVQNSLHKKQLENIPAADQNPKSSRPFEKGIKWVDLDPLRNTILEDYEHPANTENRMQKRYALARSSTPAVTDSRIGNDFIATLDHTLAEGGQQALTQIRQLLPEQLVARRYLPKELPTFSGDSSEWPQFISAFIESQSHCNYSNRENMMRLKPALKGDALRLVEDLLSYPDNLECVLNSLRSMYGNPEKIRSAISAKLRSLPAIKSEDLLGITRLANKVKGYCSTLKAARLERDFHNADYLAELEEKLPVHLRVSWGIFKRSNGCYDLNTFADWLSGIGEATVALGKVNPITKFEHNKSSGRKGHERVNIHAPAPSNSNMPEKSKSERKNSSAADNKVKCKRCSGEHPLVECGDFKGLSTKERWELATSNQLCFKCLEDHNYMRCRNRKPCGIEGCKRIHHPLLHKSKSEAPTIATESVNHHQQLVSNVLFRIVPINLYGPQENIVRAYAFLDEGSSVTLLEDGLARQLGVEGPAEDLCLKWTGSTSRTETGSRRISIGISAVSEKKRSATISGVRTVDALDLPVQSFSKTAAKGIEEFQGLPIPTYTEAKPSLLIGLAHWRLAVPMESRESKTGLIASRSRLGWAVSGLTKHRTEARVHFHECGCHDSSTLEQLLKRFFTIECHGLQSPEHLLENVEHVRARKVLQSTVRKTNGRYELGLLWRRDKVELPDSRSMALRRHYCLERKLAKDEPTYNAIRQQMADYVAKGYTRILTAEEAERKTSKTWYLPIFAVRNPNKPDKVRVVWDAAAKVGDVSLNDNLLSGPDMLCALPDILRRFREYDVAVTGDIREMFHQVRIREEDQDAQRFFWRNSTDEPLQTRIMMVMTFGATCSPCSAQFVKNQNAEAFKTQFPDAVYDIVNNHYVDDYVASYRNPQIAAEIAKNVRQIQNEAGYELRKFSSNNDHVLTRLQETTTEVERDLSAGESSESKVLGLRWNTRDDVLYFQVNWDRMDPELLNGTRRPSKRELLRHLMSVFDPLGLIANLLVQLKLLLQDVHRHGGDWDEEISIESEKRWKWWISAIQELSAAKIPRCYERSLSLTEPPAAELHVFVDASERVYAAVGYMRIVHQDAHHCVLIGAKTKLAPTKLLSIPRLELQAAVLGVRLANSIKQAQRIKFSRCIFWSDSQNVLHWLRSEVRDFKQFVAFRISEILESTTVRDWRYVPSKQNVADDCTKLKTTLDISSNSRWFIGPEFLRNPENYWPAIPARLSSTSNEEMRIIAVHTEVIRGNSTPNANNISKWRILVRSQARILKWLKNKKTNENFTPDELHEAELEIFRTCQRDVYLEEFSVLAAKLDAVLPKSNKLYELNPFVRNDDGLIRIRSRIQKAQLPYDTRNPVLLPKGHRITRLFLDHYHRQFEHQFHETVVNEVRQKVYISHLRRELKKVITECQFCKNKRAQPQPPMMGDLPEARMMFDEAPFSCVGIDYFGPVELAIGRARKKHWGVLITCLTTRAVHLDFTGSLTSDNAIMVLDRFVSRRGEPREIYCDNATTFKGIDAELLASHQAIDWKVVSEDFFRVKWHFIPPGAPHMGGSWERLIRSVKDTMKAILKDRTPTPEVFGTALCEVENILNSRPLTYVPTYPDCEEALTPNHILLGRSNKTRPIGSLPERRTPLNKMWQRALDIATRFWTRWINEYLPTLMRRTKWYHKVEPIKVGDVGVVWDVGTKNSWQLGRVVAVTQAGDGQVRSVEVKTSKGYYRRPSSKFAKLDVGEPEDPPQIHEGGNVAGQPKMDAIQQTQSRS